jgi:hypothetical protein
MDNDWVGEEDARNGFYSDSALLAMNFAAPEEDIIFEWFGYTGNARNDYWVTDGAFANQKVNYPEIDCMDSNGIWTLRFAIGNHRNIIIQLCECIQFQLY